MNRHERRAREKASGAPRLLRSAARRVLVEHGQATSSEAVARVVRDMRRELRRRG